MSKRIICVLMVLIVMSIVLASCGEKSASKSTADVVKKSQTSGVADVNKTQPTDAKDKDVIQHDDKNVDSEKDDEFYLSSEQLNECIGIVEKNDVVYVGDSTGVWKKTKDSDEKVYLTKNAAQCITTDGKTIIYTHPVQELEVATFTKIDSQIRCINVDGSDDRFLTECTSSAQPLAISGNYLYYADYYLSETFARYLFEVDLNTSDKKDIAEDVQYPKTFANKIYYTENGFLASTQNPENMVYDIKKKELAVNEEYDFESVFKYSFDGANVTRDLDGNYYYNNDKEKLDLKGLDTEKYYPQFYYDGVLYYSRNEGYDSFVEMKKSE